MSTLTTQIGSGGGLGDEHVKPKGGIFNCLDDILMANESSIVLPVRDLAQMHPIVLVEPKIEIKLELNDHAEKRSSPADRLIENLLQVPQENGHKKKSKTHSVSPHSNCSNESSASRRHHHHRHVHQKVSRDVNHSDTNKENVPAEAGVQTPVEVVEAHHHRHHHHRHHHHTKAGHSEHSHRHHHSSSTAAVAGSAVDGDGSVQPTQVLRKYIIKKITIRKQDGSTKKIVIKKPVDEPNGPVKLTKVDTKIVLVPGMMSS